MECKSHTFEEILTLENLQKYLNFSHVWTMPICKVCIKFTLPHFVPYIENCTYNGYISLLRVTD